MSWRLLTCSSRQVCSQLCQSLLWDLIRAALFKVVRSATWRNLSIIHRRDYVSWPHIRDFTIMKSPTMEISHATSPSLTTLYTGASSIVIGRIPKGYNRTELDVKLWFESVLSANPREGYWEMHHVSLKALANITEDPR